MSCKSFDSNNYTDCFDWFVSKISDKLHLCSQNPNYDLKTDLTAYWDKYGVSVWELMWDFGLSGTIATHICQMPSEVFRLLNLLSDIYGEEMWDELNKYHVFEQNYIFKLYSLQIIREVIDELTDNNNKIALEYILEEYSDLS